MPTVLAVVSATSVSNAIAGGSAAVGSFLILVKRHRRLYALRVLLITAIVRSGVELVLAFRQGRYEAAFVVGFASLMIAVAGDRVMATAPSASRKQRLTASAYLFFGVSGVAWVPNGILQLTAKS